MTKRRPLLVISAKAQRSREISLSNGVQHSSWGSLDSEYQ